MTRMETDRSFCIPFQSSLRRSPDTDRKLEATYVPDALPRHTLSALSSNTNSRQVCAKSLRQCQCQSRFHLTRRMGIASLYSPLLELNIDYPRRSEALLGIPSLFLTDDWTSEAYLLSPRSWFPLLRYAKGSQLSSRCRSCIFPFAHRITFA